MCVCVCVCVICELWTLYTYKLICTLYIYIYICVCVICITYVVYSYTDACINHNDTIIKTRNTVLWKNIPLPLFERFVCERELETEQNCNILTLTLLTITAFLSRFPVAQPGVWGPTLLGAGFLYHILSPTGLVSKLIWSPTNWLPVFPELYNSLMPPSCCARHNCTHSTHLRSRL